MIKNKEKGFLLVEIVITLVIISMSLGGIITLYLHAKELNVKAWERHIQITLASQVMEELSAQDFEEIEDSVQDFYREKDYICKIEVEKFQEGLKKVRVSVWDEQGETSISLLSFIVRR